MRYILDRRSQYTRVFLAHHKTHPSQNHLSKRCYNRSMSQHIHKKHLGTDKMSHSYMQDYPCIHNKWYIHRNRHHRWLGNYNYMQPEMNIRLFQVHHILHLHHYQSDIHHYRRSESRHKHNHFLN